jgi:hypothetical protein
MTQAQITKGGMCVKCSHPLDDHVVGQDGFYVPCLRCERHKMGNCRKHAGWKVS